MNYFEPYRNAGFTQGSLDTNAISALLINKIYDPKAVAKITDAELLRMRLVGPKVLKRIRELIPYNPEPPTETKKPPVELIPCPHCKGCGWVLPAGEPPKMASTAALELILALNDKPTKGLLGTALAYAARGSDHEQTD